ncbi:aryl-alcohol dehydrogenase-like predicted oxidoreductase [Paenochrobactrum gallinarii]|uniref:Aryl-alcohol dehydrogenase-like predicted oxidoreductase n=1 Tax=Paenochrobactrum gallinarii TaxID=643673 RepID=A0A841M1I4_9HYPH|nr:aryl-alcohol dehydrogenase-like predicted oxidoreductase [Paenochrobactrum gallinarii]
MIPWSPLARGLLAVRAADGDSASTVRAQTDKTANALYDRNKAQDDAVIAVVQKISERHGRPIAQFAFAWLTIRSGISAPIVGISKLHQFEDALGALEIRVSDEDVAEIESP